MRAKHWLSMVICCIPHLTLTALILVGGLTASAVGVFATSLEGEKTMEIGIIFALMMGIACPVIMGLMMWMMSKQMQSPGSGVEQPHNAAERLALLHKQRGQLEAEIAEVSHIAELEAQQQLSNNPAVGEGQTAATH